MPRPAFSIAPISVPHGAITAQDRLRMATHGFFKTFNVATPGVRGSFVVSGSAQVGGEALQAIPAPGQRLGPLFIASGEQNVRFLLDVAGDFGIGEVLARGALSWTIMQVANNGAVTPDVSAALLSFVSYTGTRILFGLGTPTARAVPGSVYTVTLGFTSSEGETRAVQLPPIICRV